MVCSGRELASSSTGSASQECRASRIETRLMRGLFRPDPRLNDLPEKTRWRSLPVIGRWISDKFFVSVGNTTLSFHCGEGQFFVMPLYPKRRTADRLLGKIFVSFDPISASVITQVADHRLRQASARPRCSFRPSLPGSLTTATRHRPGPGREIARVVPRALCPRACAEE